MRIKLLREVEIILDELNSKYGNEKELCLYCHSVIYGASGIIHDEECIILRLRRCINGKIRKTGTKVRS